MQYNEKLDAELKALEGDMIETLQRWIRVPSVRAERSADNAPSQPLGPTTAPGCDEPTSRCQTTPSM